MAGKSEFSNLASILDDIDFDVDALQQRYRQERDKRLRQDGSGQYVKVDGELSYFGKDPFAKENVVRSSLHDEVELLIIGGGFGGLLLAAKTKGSIFERVRFVDSAGDFGGTWYWNRYPGAGCDIESYCYLPLLEETGYMPSQKYVGAQEIFEHAQRIAKQYDLYEDALFQTGVTHMAWQEDAQRWIVSTDRGDQIRAKFVAMANGPFSKPKLPGLEGISTFDGRIFHTSRWDYDYTGGAHDGRLTGLLGKRVGVIGTGATAIQAVPRLAEWAEHLFVFQRTPSSVDARRNVSTDPDWFRSQRPGWQRERMENFNRVLDGAYQEHDLVADGWTDMFRRLTGSAVRRIEEKLGHPLTKEQRRELLVMEDYRKMNEIRSRVDELVDDDDTADRLKPWYRQFCKRPCFSDDYLQTFNRENVTLVDTEGRGVDRIVRDGVYANGEFVALDCLILATGFEVSTSFTQRIGYEVVGREGRCLSEHWRDGVRTLHGLTSHGFPNCFFIGRTQTATPLNYTLALENQTAQVAHILKEMRQRRFKLVQASQEGESQYMQEARSVSRFAQKFLEECTPGYYNNEGQIERNINSDAYGPGAVRFFEMLETWRGEGAMTGLELE